MKFVKKGMIYCHETPNSWWYSHTMAPSAIYYKGFIRVFVGAWDKQNISRITYIDLDPYDPCKVQKVNSTKPILDIGKPGMFDENGVFPAHASVIRNKIHLYYTGFQLGYKIPHYNFGGLAISSDGDAYARYSEAPILDRQDEGLFVRAGQSVFIEKSKYLTTYSAGSSFEIIGEKLRPNYEVYFQVSNNGRTYKQKGKKIISFDKNVEHAVTQKIFLRIFPI